MKNNFATRPRSFCCLALIMLTVGLGGACGDSNQRPAEKEDGMGVGGAGNEGGSGGQAGSGGSGGGKDAGRDSGDAASKDSAMDATDVGADMAGPDTGPAIGQVQTDYRLLRQGEAGVIIKVIGTNLSGAAGFTLGGLAVRLDALSTDTVLWLVADVPHGAVLGVKDLSFMIAGQTYKLDKVVAVTAITASPAGLDTNRGASDSPFRTFKQALGVSAKNDTIELKDGTYSTLSGETWEKAIPDSLTIVGQSSSGTRLVGPGENIDVDGLSFSGSAIVRSLTISGFRTAAYMSRTGTLVFENVKLLGGRYYGVLIDDTASRSTITIRGSEMVISGATLDGIRVAAPRTVLKVADGATVLGGSEAGITGQGLSGETSTETTFSVEGATIGATAADALSIWIYANKTKVNLTKSKVNAPVSMIEALAGQATSTLEVTDCTIQAPVAVNLSPITKGIEFDGATLLVQNTTILGGVWGIWQKSGNAQIRNTTFKGYYSTGYHIGNGKLDLGNAKETGGNTFVGIIGKPTLGLWDDRFTTPDAITVSGTTFNGKQPSASVATGPVWVDDQYAIFKPGNKIVFYGFPGTATVNISAFLQGPYDTVTHAMRTSLYDQGIIPLAQPYNTAPWNFGGSEVVKETPKGVVDWVLVEIRRANDATKIVAIRAAYIMADGTVVDTDGQSPVAFGLPEGKYYVVLRHRNHLAIMSADPITISAKSQMYDFAGAQARAFGAGAPMVEVEAGVFGLYGGDGDANGGVGATDKNFVWIPQNGTSGYDKMGDFNLDGGVDTLDLNLIWRPNNGSISLVPDPAR